MAEKDKDKQLVVETMSYEEYVCDHYKIYNESKMFCEHPVFFWKCAVCHAEGSDKEDDIIVEYEITLKGNK